MGCSRADMLPSAVPDPLRERMLASYAELGEAMVHQNVLEAEGIPCRVADLARFHDHMLGVAGGLGRSVGLWVLEADAERAASILATLGSGEGAVDEEALATEAMAAGSTARTPDEPPVREGPAPPGARASGPGWIGGAALATIAIALAVLVSRGCS